MHVRIEVPEIPEFAHGFPGYWVKAIFVGHVSPVYGVVALASTYVRLVEAALTEYRYAELRLKEFWGTHDSVRLSAMHRAISHFESCITDAHRAVLCFNRLRRHKEAPQWIKYEFNTNRPAFASDKITKRLRAMRHAIHHLDEMVLNGTIQEGSPYVLSPGGPETPLPDAEPGQSLKTIDRLAIGGQEILFSEIARWLTEMGRYAQKLADGQVAAKST